MSRYHRSAERMRRWGWVAIALSLPSLAFIGAWLYESVVYGWGPDVFLLTVFGLPAVLVLVGGRMLLLGYDLRDGATFGRPLPARLLGWGAAYSDPPGHVLRSLVGFGFSAFFLLTTTTLFGFRCAPRSKAYLAAMKSDLKNFVLAEESYFVDNNTYGDIPYIIRTPGGRVPSEPGGLACDEP